MRWRAVGIIALLLAAMAASWAAAASLSVNGGAVQAGSDVVGQCDPDQVSVSYTVQFQATPAPPEFKITTVTVSGIDKNCNNRTLMLQLTGPGGAGLLSTSITFVVKKHQAPCTGGPPDPFTCQVMLNPPLSAAIVSDVHVALRK